LSKSKLNLQNQHLHGRKICNYFHLQSLKHLLDHVFTDPKVKDEALDFVFSLIKDERFMESLIGFLVSALKSELFMKVFLDISRN